jgi:hypothetical protein
MTCWMVVQVFLASTKKIDFGPLSHERCGPICYGKIALRLHAIGNDNISHLFAILVMHRVDSLQRRQVELPVVVVDRTLVGPQRFAPRR